MLEPKATELGRLIGQSQEYQAVRRANETLESDQETVELLRKMEQLRDSAHRLLERGERPSPEMERELEELLASIQQRDSYQRLVAAQENFEKVMQRVNDWILDGIRKGAASSIITLG